MTAKNTPTAHSKRERALNGPIIPALFAIATPILITNLFQSLYQFIDAYWIGKLGGDAVASVAVSFPLVFLMISLGMGFSFAGSTLIAQHYGAGNTEKVNYTAAQSIITIAIVGLVLGITGYLLTPFFLELLGAENEVKAFAEPYLKISYIGIIFMFIYNMFQSILRGVNEVKLPMYIIGGTVLLNAILDPIFINGLGPIPAYGVAGAAIVTATSQAISAIIGLAILLTHKTDVHINLKDLKPSMSYFKTTLRLGTPSSFEMSARALGMILMTFLITSFGTINIAAFGAAGNIFNFIIIPSLGLSMATAALVGQNLGAQKLDRVTQIIKKSSIIAFSALTVVGIIIVIFAPQFIQIFIQDEPEVIATGAYILRISGLTFGLMALQISLTGVLRAAGQMTLAMMLAIISIWVVQFPIAYVLSKHTTLGADGVWWSFPITNIIMVIITGYIIWEGSWKNKKLID